MSGSRRISEICLRERKQPGAPGFIATRSRFVRLRRYRRRAADFPFPSAGRPAARSGALLPKASLIGSRKSRRGLPRKGTGILGAEQASLESRA